MIRTTSPLALRRFVQVGLTITVVLASFSTELAVAGHRWRISPFRSREGIPYQRVRDLLETPDGAIWIATWGGGAARVKDTEWEHFDEDNGLLNNWVRCLEVDGEGAIWIGTSRGVCVYRDGRFEEVTSNPPLPSVGIRALKLTRNGQMWVALQIENGNEYPLCVVDVANRRSKAMPFKWEINSIAESIDGRVWVANRNSEGGVECWDGQRWTGVELPQIERAAEELVEDARGRIWFVGGSVVQLISEDQPIADRITHTMPEGGDGVRCATFLDDGELIVGGATQTWQVSADSKWHPLELPRKHYCDALLIAQAAPSLWIGTQSGLLRGAPYAWRRMRDSGEHRILLPDTLCVDRMSDPICIDASRDRDSESPDQVKAPYRIMRFVSNGWARQTGFLDLGDDEIPQAMVRAGEDAVWILTFNMEADGFASKVYQVGMSDGLVRKRFDGAEAMSAKPVGGGTFRYRLQVKDGYLLCTCPAGVYELRESEKQWKRLGGLRADDLDMSDMSEAADGTTYVCYRNDEQSTGRVDTWRDGVVRKFDDSAFNLNDVQYEAVCCSQDGRVWFGSHDHGILVHDTAKKFDPITIRQGLVSNLISGLFEDSSQSIWVGYRRKGAAVLRKGADYWVNFSESHGMPMWEVNRFFEDREGHVWIAMNSHKSWFPTFVNGVYRYEPETDPPDTKIVASPSGEVAQTGTGVFSFNGVDAWDNTPRDSLHYQWRIVPSDTGWSPFESRASVATDVGALKPGTYRFQVRAIDIHGNMDPEPDECSFSVAGPIWTRASVFVPGVVVVGITLLSLVALLQNHTSLRSSERQLRQSNDQLQAEVDERMRAESEKERLKEQLHQSQKLEAIGTLASGICHDFNNYLMAIVGFTEVLRLRNSEPEVQECLDGIMKASDQATVVTRALQTFSRRENAEKRTSDLNRIVQRSLRLLRPMLPASIEIVEQLATESPLSIHANTTQIQQVILNLAINARDAMPDGGTLTLTTYRDDDFAVLSVADTGVGMTSDERERAMEPFFTTKSRGQGTGLGLSIVHGIVTGHSGQVEVNSNGPNDGSEFVARFPFTADNLVDDDSGIRTVPTSGRGETILIAEDHPEIQTLMGGYFRSIGYGVLLASDGNQALEVFEKHSPRIRLLIFDIDLPKRSGVECLKLIQKTHSHVPSLLISGMSDEPKLDQQFPDHVVFISKPFSMARLSELVRDLLRRVQDS